MKVLVTGAGGYIGTALVDMLLGNGFQVTGYDRCFFGEEVFGGTLKNPLFSLKKKDIRDIGEDDLRGVDAVFDLAALSNDQTGELDKELTYSINYSGRLNVAEAARRAGVKRYLLASSCNVYGAGEGASLTEASGTCPVSTYAKVNLETEDAVLPLAEDGFSVTVLRLPTIYGLSKRMRFDLVLNQMTLDAVRNGSIHVNGGKQWRPLLHVRDAARAFELAVASEGNKINGEVFNLGDSVQNFRILDLAHLVRRELPFPVDLEVLSGNGETIDYNVSFDKIRNVLGFKAGLTPSAGVREVYDAIINHRTETGIRSVTFKWYESLMRSGGW
jgi:nucleoside-diphosphate-sugar epimerase